MEIEHIILIVLGVLAVCWLILLACFVIACVCFFKTFYSPKSRKKMKNKVTSITVANCRHIGKRGRNEHGLAGITVF